MEAELFCESDRLSLFDNQTEGLIKMTCVVRSFGAPPDWRAGQEQPTRVDHNKPLLLWGALQVCLWSAATVFILQLKLG